MPLNGILLLVGVVILACILAHHFTEKLPIPTLLVFIGLGMLFGENGLFRIRFNDYSLAETVCSVCLIFIMYYGGFGTNWKAARPVAVQSVLLSTLGVLLTAGLTGLFIHLVLRLSWLESLLIGSVIASTDAASVFNILRSRSLNLKFNTASLLELESGSNDPMSYMLTVVLVTLMTGGDISVPLVLAKQLVFGILFGVCIGIAASFLLRRSHAAMAQGDTIFVFAAALIAYALPSMLGGNGYLSVYLCGILMGNAPIAQKRDLVRFFDAITGITQMMIFFLLGLLVTPVHLPRVFVPALCILAFLTLVGRPVAVAALLAPFRAKAGQIALVSWAGLRGAASIVFAIYAVLHNAPLTYDLFDLVFCIVLLSMGIQGTLLPRMAHRFAMIDDNADVRRTFNDYQEENDICFIKLHLDEGHPWAGKLLREIVTPPDFLVSLIIRRDEGVLVPSGSTRMLAGDLLVIAAREFENRASLTLQEVSIDASHKLCGKQLRDAPPAPGTLVVLVQRDGRTIIPTGDTGVQAGDTLVVARY